DADSDAAAVGGHVERDRHLALDRFRLRSALLPAALLPPRPAAEQVAKVDTALAAEPAEHVEQPLRGLRVDVRAGRATEAAGEPSEPAPAAREPGLRAGEPELVVLGLLLRVAEDVVGGLHFLVLGVGLLVARIA